MIEESILELDKLEEEFTWLVCEEPCRDIAVLLEDLLVVHGSAFVNEPLILSSSEKAYTKCLTLRRFQESLKLIKMGAKC